MRNLKLIIQREYLARVRNKTFVIMTFLSPIIMVGMIALIAYLSSVNNDEKRIVGLHDEANLFEEEFVDTKEVTYVDYSSFSLEQAIDSVDSKEYYGLLYIPVEDDKTRLANKIEFFAKDAPSNSFISGVEQKIATKLTNSNLVENGVDLTKLANAKIKVSLQIETFEGEQTSKMANYIKMFFGGAAGYLLMMFIIIYGNMVMRSVIEEKTNRIIEIIISSVKPMQLMLGKILGTSFAGITQFLIWVFLGGILLFGLSAIFGLDVQPPEVSQQAVTKASNGEIQKIIMDIVNLPLGKLILCFLFYFIGGYFLYSAIYAAIGAAVDSETDTQQFMFPIIIPLMLGIYVGFFSVIENPHGIVSTVFSFIPLTSPVVMLMRIPFGVPWWEILLSILVLIGTIFLVTLLAAKIYRIGILMYGKKPTYKELYKWLKY